MISNAFRQEEPASSEEGSVETYFNQRFKPVVGAKFLDWDLIKLNGSLGMSCLFRSVIFVNLLDEANINIKNTSEDSIIWEYSNQVHITNNFPEIEECVKNVIRNLNVGSFTKCKPHLSVHGYAGTGKTILAATILPYFLSLELIRTKNLYNKFNVIYIDMLDKPKDISFSLFIAQKVTQNFELTEKDVKFTCQVEKLFQSYLSEDESRFTFVVCDDIQSLNPNDLYLLKKFLKSRNLPRNILSIWTGSTQIQLFKILEKVPSNGFSCYDDNFVYTIPTTFKQKAVRDTITFVNYLYKDFVLQGKETFNTIYAFIGVLHFSYVRQIGNAMACHNLKLYEAVEQLIFKLFKIYDRDLKETINEASEEDLQRLLICSSQSLEPLLQLCNISFSFFLYETTLRDILIKKYVYMYLQKRKGDLKIEKNGQFHYQLMLPYIILGENIRQGQNDEAVSYLQQVTVHHQLFGRELEKNFSKAIKVIGNQDALGYMWKSLIGISNILSHDHEQAACVKDLVVTYWFNNDPLLFLKTTGDLLSYF
ncbi:hypothetical protein C9374_011505 [Naegleria lovaniensis]|uniref:Uncharacterized protein n=1 Tax=Naegleria lovaniensis TaxID=51637 RepID=A0AA88GXH2_NAELO|nr:uncharacterized protein C9374_011505 [Naegleria lovaniensis]KAG2392780.1 hypothetical protein C9374_011505 [Naegleria lovaniensis]